MPVREIKTRLIIDGEKAYKDALASINREQRVLQSELKATVTSFGANQSSVEALTAKNAVLNREIEQQRIKVDSLKQAVKDASDKYGEADKKTDGYRIQLNNATAALNKLETEAAETQKQVDKLNDKFAQAGDRLSASAEKIKNAGEKITDAGKNMSMYITAPLIAIGAAAENVGMQYEAQMSRVQAISSATGQEMEQLDKQALQLGADTAFSAKQAAQGMENLASAGFNVNETMTAMPGMLDLAASGGLDVATSADVAASSLREFELEATQAGHVADVFAQAAADTNAGVIDMGMSMKYAAPSAHALGLSLEDTAASVGIMADAGIKGEQAGTTLRGALVALASPSKEAAGEMKNIGFEAFDASGKMYAWPEVISRLKDSLSTLTNEEKTNALATIFGRESLSGMLTLVNAGPAKLSELIDSLKNSDGAAKTMAATMQSNVKGAVEQMNGSLETAAITLSKTVAPTVKDAAETVTKLANKFSELTPETQKTILVIGGLAAATGPVVAGLGSITSGVGTLIKGFGDLSKKVADAGGAMALLTNPLALAAGAIVATGLGVMAINGDFDQGVLKIRAFAQEAKDLGNTLENSKNQFEDNASKITSNASAAAELTNQLYSLESVEQKTNEQKNEMTNLVEQLNRLYPNMNLILDQNTFKLNQNKQAVDDLIGSMKTQALISNTADSWAKAKNDYANIVRLSQEADAMVAEAQAKYDKLYDNGHGLKFGLETGALLQAHNALTAAIGAAEEFDRQEATAEKTVSNLNNQLKEQSKDLSTTGNKIGTFAADTQTSSKQITVSVSEMTSGWIQNFLSMGGSVQQLSAIFDGATAAQQQQLSVLDQQKQNWLASQQQTLDSLNIAQQSYIEAQLNGLTEMTDEQKDILNRQVQDFVDQNKQFEALTQEHLNQMGSFTDRTITQQVKNLDKFLTNLNARNAKFDEWQQAIGKLVGKISPEVLAELEKLGPGYDNVVDGLVAAAEGKKGGKKTLKDFETAMTTRMREAKEASLQEMNILKDAAGAAGGDTTNAVAVGMDDKKQLEKVKTAAADVSKTATTELNKLPATVKIIGADAGQGLADGLRSKLAVIKAASGEAAGIIEPTMRKVLDSRSPSKVTEAVGFDAGMGPVVGLKKAAPIAALAAADLAKQLAESLSEGLKVNTKKGTAALKDAIADAVKEAKTLQKAAEDLAKSHSKSLEDLQKQNTDNVKKLTEDYTRAVDDINKKIESRKNQIAGFGGLFDAGNISDASKVTADSVLGNMRQSAGSVVEFQSTIAALTAKNLPQELIDQIQKMGVENLTELKALNSMTGDQLAEYVSLWTTKQQAALSRAQSEFAGELADLKANYDQQLLDENARYLAAVAKENADYLAESKKLILLAEAEMNKLGVTMAEGLTKGIKGQTATIISNVNEVIQDVLAAMSASLGIGMSQLGVGTGTPTTTPTARSYIVKAGDTLSEIAAKLDTTVARLVELNKIKDPNRINPGQLISYAVGTSYVPFDMVAQIHKGERIIPADQNTPDALGVFGQYGAVKAALQSMILTAFRDLDLAEMSLDMSDISKRISVALQANVNVNTFGGGAAAQGDTYRIEQLVMNIDADELQDAVGVTRAVQRAVQLVNQGVKL